MADIANPAEDAWSAIKSRTAGPIGTFILVWGLNHAKVVSYIFFDAAGKSDLPQAQAKINVISELLSTETFFSLVGVKWWGCPEPEPTN